MIAKMHLQVGAYLKFQSSENCTMFDRQLLVLTKPVVDQLAKSLLKAGVSANQVSLAGFALGMVAAVLIAHGNIWAAIAPLLLNRLFDGLDGAVARFSAPTDRGAFLDITLDFLFYAAVPLSFGFCNPANNALAAATLLASFIGTGVSFLAYAIMAEKRGEKSTAYPSKSFYYLGGLTEGFETVSCFVAMCIWPQYFAGIAYVYAAMCCVTTLTRLVAGWQAFGSSPQR
jgi:phosphatidylglycerophosphate synthase